MSLDLIQYARSRSCFILHDARDETSSARDLCLARKLLRVGPDRATGLSREAVLLSESD